MTAGSSWGWCGVKSLMRAVPILWSSSMSRHAMLWEMLYMNRAGRLLSSSFTFGRGSGIVPVVPKGRTCVGGVQLWYHRRAGSVLVVEWGMMLYLYVASMMANCQRDGGRRAWVRAALAAFISVRLSLSAMPFNWGWWGMVVVCLVPMDVKKIWTC